MDLCLHREGETQAYTLIKKIVSFSQIESQQLCPKTREKGMCYTSEKEYRKKSNLLLQYDESLCLGLFLFHFVLFFVFIFFVCFVSLVQAMGIHEEGASTKK